MTPQKKNKPDANKIISMESFGIVAPLRRPKCLSGSEKMTKPILEVEENPQINGPDKVDPNTMDFSQLIDLMHPKFITDYLQRILNFLLDDTLELNFPNIAPFKRAFLERLVVDQNNLKCSRFNDNSKAVANRILIALRCNSHKFKWIHSYENCSANRGVLIYKKQYITDKNKRELKHPSSIPPSFTLPDNKTTKQITIKSIPTNFKIQWLNTTLKFIKDDTRMILDYAEMTLEMAEFVFSMINQPKLGLDSYGYKSMYAPLWEAMKIFSLKYDYKLDFKNNNNVGTMALVLQKIPKAGVKLTGNENSSRKVTSTRVRTPSPTISSASSSTSINRNSSPLLKRPQAFLKLQKISSLIDSLGPIYITDCLNKLLNFIIKDCMASLILCSTTKPEETFLSRILALAKTENKHWIFKNPCDRSTVKAIHVGISEAKAKGFWSITQTLKVISKKPRKTEMHFKKIPKYNNGNTKAYYDLKITKKESIKPPEECSSRLKFLRALRVSIDNMSNKSVNNIIEEPKSSKSPKNGITSVDSKTPCIEKSRETNASKNTISFQSAGQLDVVDQSINQVIDQPVTSIDLLPKSRKKIFEAMATPMDSDKGSRMMKLMGWSGGALGARGEGITEPIIPAIQTKTGAGLGHIPEPKPPKAKKENKPATHVTVKRGEQLPKKLTKAERTNFRITFLKHLLEHIKGDSTEFKIEFEAMSLAETKFMQAALLNFNNRRKLGLNTKEEVKYLEQIDNELQDSQYVFNAEVDSLSRSAILKKSIQPIRIATPKVKPEKNKPKTEKSNPIALLASAFITRLNLLENISKFLQSSDVETEFMFNKPKDKQRLDLIVAAANTKQSMDCSTRKELAIYSDIINNMKGCCLFVKPVDVLKCKYVLQKVFKTKIINSSPRQPKNVKKTNEDNNNIQSDGEDCVINENCKEIDNIPNNYKDQSDNNSDQSNDSKNNKNIKKILDIQYEKQMFQNEINNIEKRDTVYKCIEVGDEQSNCDEISSLDSEIRDLENTIRNSDLDVTNTNIKKEYIYIKEEENIKEEEEDIKEEEYIKDGIGTTNSTAISKRSRSDPQSSEITLCNNEKNKNITNKDLLCIVPKNYPTDNINIDTAKEIQTIIANEIDATVFLPLIKSFGIKNGTLLYCCYNLQSRLWLENLVENTNLNIKIIPCDHDIYEIDNNYVLDMKINTLIKQDVSRLLLNLEIFNIGLLTNEWSVVNEIVKDDCLILTVTVDHYSYKFICEHKFELHVGFDRALFRLHW